MNKNITKLHRLAAKPSRLIIGLMSGTSLDGLDIALCRISGSGLKTRVDLLHFETINYPASFKVEIRAVFSKYTVSLEKLCLLNGWVARVHAGMILTCLKKWKIAPSRIDLVASHGQTIFHSPKALHKQAKFGNSTLQIGDGDQLAVSTGIITLSDFRQKHIAAGGEGAPLAVYGDYLLLSKKGENRIMLNIGGIANFTFLPGSRDAQKVFSTDTGPGNTLMDAYVQKYFSIPYDKKAAIAKKGTVHEGLLHGLLANPFFGEKFPKTTGPELFNLGYLENAQQLTNTKKLSHEDVMATLNRFSAASIALALEKCIGKKETFTIYTSGGGMHNPLLLRQIQSFFPNHPFFSSDSLGVNPDAKEAILFAILANETVAGGKNQIGNDHLPALSMGKVSFPL